MIIKVGFSRFEIFSPNPFPVCHRLWRKSAYWCWVRVSHGSVVPVFFAEHAPTSSFQGTLTVSRWLDEGLGFPRTSCLLLIRHLQCVGEELTVLPVFSSLQSLRKLRKGYTVQISTWVVSKVREMSPETKKRCRVSIWSLGTDLVLHSGTVLSGFSKGLFWTLRGIELISPGVGLWAATVFCSRGFTRDPATHGTALRVQPASWLA